jgi:Ca-activated chloride channel family protein
MTQRVKFSAGESSNEFIAQLWALRRVGWLLDEVRLRGESKELRDEVVDLARRYAIVTPYTSYLIVEDEARRGVPVAARSFQMLDRDAEAQSFYRKSWGDLSGKKDGYDGALAGRQNSSLKSAEAPVVALEKAKSEAFGGVIAGNAAPADASAVGAGASGSIGGYVGKSAQKLRGTAGEVQTKLADIEQQTRWVNGKAFTQNGANWSDTAIQSVKQDAKRNRVQFASQEYFDLLTNKPESAQWLALGRNVQFTIGAELYEVYE